MHPTRSRAWEQNNSRFPTGPGSGPTGCVEKKRKEVLGSSKWVQKNPMGGVGWAMGSNPLSLVGMGCAKDFMAPEFKEAHYPSIVFGRLFSPKAPQRPSLKQRERSRWCWPM